MKTGDPIPSFLLMRRNQAKKKKGRVNGPDMQPVSGRDEVQVSWHPSWEPSSTLPKKSSNGVSGQLPQLEALQDTSQQEVPRNV